MSASPSPFEGANPPWEPWMRNETVAALKEHGLLYILQQGRVNGEQAAIDEFIRSCDEEAKTIYVDLPEHIEHGFRIAIEAIEYCRWYGDNHLLTEGPNFAGDGTDDEESEYEDVDDDFWNPITDLVHDLVHGPLEQQVSPLISDDPDTRFGRVTYPLILHLSVLHETILHHTASQMKDTVWPLSDGLWKGIWSMLGSMCSLQMLTMPYHPFVNRQIRNWAITDSKPISLMVKIIR